MMALLSAVLVSCSMWMQEPRERLDFDLEDRSSLGIGIGGAALIESLRVGDPKQPSTQVVKRSDAGGGGELRLRFVGYGEALSRNERFVVMLHPDMHMSLVFGARVRDAGGRALGFFGAIGQVGGAVGVASPGRFGVYAKGSLTGYFFMVGRGEGAYWIAHLGLGTGLRVAPNDDVTLLIGPRLDGVGGVQSFSGPRRITQLAPGGDATIQATFGDDIYLGLTGSFDITALNQAWGGQRMNGRAMLDLTFPTNSDIRIGPFAMYRGMWVEAEPGSRLNPAGLNLTSHTILFGVGFGSQLK